MFSPMSPYTRPSKLAPLLLAALFCCCFLLQPVQCLPAKRDAAQRVRRLEKRMSENPVESTASIEARAIVLTPTNSSIPGFAYLGCFTDSQLNSLVLPSATPRYLLNGLSYTSTTSLTWATCGLFCSSYQYAGISAGSTCRCGNSFTFSPGLSLDASCQIPCSGSPSQACGGSTRSSVFFNTKFGSNVSPAGPSSPASAATLPQPTLQQPSGIVSLASVVLPSSLLSATSPVIQLPTATQLIPTTQNLAAPLLGLTSAIAVATSIPLVAALSSMSSVRSTAETAPAISLSAVSAQLVPVQSAIGLSTPILPALVPGTIVSSFAQGLTVPLATSQASSGAPAPPTLTASSAQPAPFLLPVAAPALSSLTTAIQPVTLSSNLLTQSAPISSAAPSLLPQASPSVQLSTPVLPAAIFSSVINGLPASSPLLLPPSPALSPVPSSSIALGLLPSISPAPTLTLAPLSEAGVINGPVLLPLTGAAPSSPVLLLNVPSSTGIPLVGAASSSLVATPIQPSSSNVAIGPGVVGLLPGAIPVSSELTVPAPASVTVPPGANLPLTVALPPLPATPLVVAPLPLATPASLLPAVPQLDNIPLTPAPALPTSDPLVVGNIPQDIASPVSSVGSSVPWWIITEFLEPHGLPPPPIFATPPPLALPALPVEELPSSPVPSLPSPPLESTSTNNVLGAISADLSIAQVIESGMVVDKVFTWSLYSDGSAQVDGTVLSPETGPIQAYLSDGTRIGMDSAGLYIGWDHRVPYPPEFLQIIRGYLMPPPQLFL